MQKVEEIEKKIPKKDKIKRLIDISMRHLDRINLPQSSAEMTYFILLSIVPIILVIANVIPMLPMQTDQVLNLAQQAIPADVYGVIEPTLTSYLEGGSGGAISIGLITALFSASKIVSIMRRSLDEIYGAQDTDNFVVDRIVSVLIMIAIIALTGAALFFFIFGEQILLFIGNIFGLDVGFINVFLVLRWVVVALLFPAIFLIIYHVLPNHNHNLTRAIPGSIFASVGAILLSQFFSLYLSVAGGDAVANATFGAVIALMLFLYLANMIVFIGAMLNTFIFEWRHHESVEEYERAIQREEQLQDANWKGYPDSDNVLILKRKLYKSSYLKELHQDNHDTVTTKTISE